MNNTNKTTKAGSTVARATGLPGAEPSARVSQAAAGIRMIEPERMPELVDEMLRLGYSDATVEGILGGNLLRVAQRVWKVSAKG